MCEFGLAIQDYILYDFDTKCIHWIETLGVKCVKILFLKFFVENKCFSKTFKLILMHFIHEINWFDCFLHKTSAVFQKILFSRLLIDRMCFLTNKKSLEFLSLVLPGSIAPRLVLNQSNLFF